MAGGMAMKMLKGPVMDVVGRIVNQINVIDGVQQSIQGYAAGIPGVWLGEDAGAFTDEVQSRVIPEIMDLLAAIGGMPGGLSNAMDIVSGADSRSRGLASGLGDVFSSIF